MQEITIQTPTEMQSLINALFDSGLLEKLLPDRTTHRNLLWQPSDEMQLSQIVGDTPERPVIPRWMKTKETQKKRSKKQAEVYTPSHIVNDMVGMVFTQEEYAQDWRKCVNDTFLEITCGEGAFITTRYDMADGRPIPMAERRGVLDRKLQMVREYAPEYEREEASFAALKSTYGYEYQGDSLLLARINVLLDFAEHIELLFDRPLTLMEADDAAEIITWNLWQMDGLRGTVPGAGQKTVIMDWQNKRQCYYDT